ncbi:hypothetical protein Nepgr_011960 [Nepenthes gracilis]|uniref:Uncharacterized protein n=1 Tax=Nepenthes gracilis TaxID=150966 RepID=A0AAD3SG45_NEPGR|nr:hypothetical protein Nepgr_011960 [Nepenthes gracilis]
MKREELLQYAQSAITGLKMSADLARIDMEVSSFRTKLNLTEIQSLSTEANGKISEETTLATTEALQEALMQVQIYSNLKALLLEKKAIHSGDSPEVHAQKVDKLKILLESLAISTTKAENRILDHRSHKEEALSFRLAKVNEVSQLEKELAAEIGKLERQKDVLETELKKVNSSLAFANARLRNAIEERQQFDEASNEILQLLQTKEEELSGSVASCRTETDVLNLWISFIEYAWNLQLVCAKQKEEQINDELGRYAEYFANLVLQLLPACKNELGIFMTHFKELVEKLTANDGLDKAAHLDGKNHDEYLASARERKNLEEKYLDLEAKLITTLGVVESIKQLYTQNEDFSRKQDQRIEELLDALREIKDEFDSIKRPNLQVETPTMATRRAAPNTSSKETPTKLKKPSKEKYSKVQVVNGQDFLDSDEELATLESEFMKIIRGHAAEEINSWES